MEKLLEILGLLLYPWKFGTKQNFTLGNFAKLCYTRNFNAEKQDPWRSYINFFDHPLKLHLFFTYPMEFPHVVSSVSLDIQCPQPPSLDFSGIAQWRLTTRPQCSSKSYKISMKTLI